MKNIIIPAMFVLVLFFSCKNENPNKTTQLPLDSIEIVTDTMSIDFKCLRYSYPVIDSNYLQEYLIRNENEYDSLLRKKCPKYTLPAIDFSKYMLAGYKIFWQDTTIVIRNVKKDNINHIITYHMDVFKDNISLDIQDYFYQSMNWLLIPQMDGNWSFKFDTNNFKRQ